ncbi:MAG TPA: efflux RND transporter periplasmic adaptor subunit [Bacteroidota bacterium]|nr:efflux RND transporter periplasmic adaptor subunit [Bacteroidota bacterium]
MKKKIMYSSAGAALLVVLAYFLFFRNSKPPYDFRYDKVSQGDISVYVTATGTINPVTSIDVGTQVSGIITKLYADFNSVVKKGQVIAQIDTTFLYQTVLDARATLDKAIAQRNDSKRTLDRTKALVDRQLDNQADLDAAMTTYETNVATAVSAQAALDRAIINLSYATIYAPIDGVVINRAVNIGQTVAASFSSPTLYTIANDLRKMQIETTVDETDIGRVSIGQIGTFTVDAYPDDKFSGTVSQIRLAATNVSNVVNYIVIIDVDNNELKLMPGMTANVKLLVGSSTNALRVSNVALRFQPPAELIDSTKLMHRSGNGSFAQNQNGTGSPAVATDPVQGRQMNGSFASVSEADRARFHTVRDSILKAHGGTLSQEDMHAEMQKYFAKQARKSKTQQPIATTKRTSTTFGITQTFPEYEKSPYVVDHQSGFGRVWIMNADKKLEPVYIRTGLSDGKFTEITTTKLQVGDQILLGASSSTDDASNQQLRSPLQSQQQGPGRGGMR